MIVYLIGSMGSGKSTTGNKAAKKLGWNFADLDKMIEDTEGNTIAEIFKCSGETFFRLAERKALKRATEITGNTIVATGGGTPCFHDNLEIMKRTGKIVYLKLNPGRLAHRLKHSKTERPLLDGPADMIEDIITKILEMRKDIYAQADYILEDDDANADELVKLAEKLNQESVN